ncbi:MAG TPA: CotH kinase family protein, partial [Ilumatobacteraceae bacterium]|nr:CotH kinase family protein [Ilumatobacteraceae bacterium]
MNAASPRVILNELNYHNADNNPAGDFVELYNTTGAAVDLTNWCISGTGFCFGPGVSIAPHGFVVVTGTMYDGSLSNSGERIRLRDDANTTVDDVTYDDEGEWPAIADGEGHSLQRRDSLLAGTSPANWASAPPSPGAANSVAGTGLLPAFKAVTHTVLPAPGQALTVSATLNNSTSATLIYRIGFGDEVQVPMTVTGSTANATIPGQAAGALVRYRLSSLSTTNGASGGWPRQGDGAYYTGTTVATTITSKLPRFEWFMDDATYYSASHDLALSGDDGYPCVFAYNGQVFDNTKARVKGQVTRYLSKKKWKIILAPGHALSIPGLLPEPVDEFALHSGYTDKSFLRETLASEMMTSAGIPVSQAFPVRLERNNSFFGLYTYVEQPDGTWRGRFGLDDSLVYEAGPDLIFGELAAGDANLSQASLRKKYDKETFEYDNDDALRGLIRSANALSGTSFRNWAYANLNVSSVVNAIAASSVIQHQDWGQKNFRLVFDEYGRWGVIPSDFDLVLGRRGNMTLGPLDSNVYIGGSFEHPGGPLFGKFWYDPELSQMIRRRIRELTQQILDPSTVAARVSQLNDLVREEAAHDRQIWGTYGPNEVAESAGNKIISAYVTPQFNRILGTLAHTGRVANTQQPNVPDVAISTVLQQPTAGVPEHLTVTNRSNDTVDLSGFTVEGIDFVIPGGTVLLPGRTVVFVSHEWGSLTGAFGCCLYGGTYPGDIADGGERLTLRTPEGVVVSMNNITPANTQTHITGLPNRSALVSLVTTDSSGAGWLQVLPCGATPGGSSNLNTDMVGQTRAVLAVVQFDAGGNACIYNQTATHIIADIQGYFAPGAFDDVADVRLLDTRQSERPGAGSQTVIHGIPNS